MKRLTGIFGLLIGMIILSGCGDKIKTGEDKTGRQLVEGVVVENVKPVEVAEYYEASGTIRAINTSIISAKLMGEVRDIKVNVSTAVRKGDVLIILNSPDIEARVETATEAQGEADKRLKVAGKKKSLMEKTFERFKKLYAEKAVSGQEFDEIKTKMEVAGLEYEQTEKSLKRAEASLKEAEAFRDYTVVRSPVDGIVAQKKIDVGSMTAPGMPLLIIEKPAYRVEVSVDERMIPFVSIGMPVEIFIDALNMKTTGKVGEIVHQIDPGTRTFTVKVDLKESGQALRGGLYSTARFPVEKKERLFVPEDAVVTRGALKGIYTVSEDKVIALRFIKTGKKKDGMLEVLSGLNKGERIIVHGADKAVEGRRVR